MYNFNNQNINNQNFNQNSNDNSDSTLRSRIVQAVVDLIGIVISFSAFGLVYVLMVSISILILIY